jgi:hypothetical protein
VGIFKKICYQQKYTKKFFQLQTFGTAADNISAPQNKEVSNPNLRRALRAS